MSDDEEQFDAKSHKNLLQAISSLGKTQHIRKPTRSEPQAKQDEFHLMKGSTKVLVDEHASAQQAVGINDIVKILKTTKKHVDAGKLLKNVQSTRKVLNKPLEKPVSDRIRRTIGYESAKKKLARWDAVVAKNRSAETQVFPLPTETIYINTSSYAKPMQVSLKSDLALEMDATDAKLRELKKQRTGDTTDEKELARQEKEQLKKKLTRDELIAKRRELAYVKMRESQKSAKARMQNKIKSKKYHKLLKRQQILEQMKQFELLQKTNPEAALEKLNALEKNRALERASLRHKNTGTWAKNLQIRAKYDKDVRKDLAEQLEVSRKLTQVKKDCESDDEAKRSNEVKKLAEQLENSADYDPFNPWTRVGSAGTNKHAKPAEEETNWRKYWMERNKNEQSLKEYREDIKEVESHVLSDLEDEKEEIIKTNIVKAKKLSDRKKQKNKLNSLSSGKVQKTVQRKIKATKSKKPIIENGWLVEELVAEPKKSDQNIDDIFDAQEDKIRKRLSGKLKKLLRKSEQLKKGKTITKPVGREKKEKNELKNLKDLSFKSQTQRPEIDEELNHEELAGETTKANGFLMDATITSTTSESVPASAPATATSTIDPNKLAMVTLKQHRLGGFNSVNADIGDAEYDDAEYDEATEKQLTISQAFEDDDIIADFSADKSKDSEVKNTEIQLGMPGWGLWAGAGITFDANKAASRNKRMILKLAPEEKRRDENKGGVYINEEASKPLRAHLVSDLPFPFTSLQDYEASIRAPIGRSFVPETAFRMLTRPAVITRKGAVIDPMDESELVKPARRLPNVVDRRIARANKEAMKNTSKSN